MESSTVTDIWGNSVEITESYVSYRNRLIDIHLIHTLQRKGKRVLLNTYKQNTGVPTMCIFFEDAEKAEEAYQTMKVLWYGAVAVTEKKDTQPELSTSTMLYILILGFALPIVLFATGISAAIAHT